MKEEGRDGRGGRWHLVGQKVKNVKSSKRWREGWRDGGREEDMTEEGKRYEREGEWCLGEKEEKRDEEKRRKWSMGKEKR